ncbi:hypothetical protein VTI74DRAFT_10192 [Chaetomium olivicolor]
MWLPSPFQAAAIALLAWSSLVQDVAAQVTTDCFPMNKTCPPNPAFGMDYNFNFNRTPNLDVWETLPNVGPVHWDSNTGAGFSIKKQGDSPTIRSKFYYFWGRTEIWLKAAKGTGVISSVMMLSDNLDEIDWEFLGGNETHVQSNFFGKGIQDHTRASHHLVPGGVQNDYHNYTTIWTKDALEFWIDGKNVRTLLPKDANNTYNYPQTPMRLSIGIWAGGDPRLSEGIREWAGGDTDYSKGPFDMFVKSAHVTDFSSGKEYLYSDRSGSWESIKIIEGNSTVKDVINAPPEKTLSEKWNDLSSGSKIAIYASISGFFGLMFLTGIIYCIRQRRRGAREAKIAEARAEAERLELERFKKAGIDPDSFASQASEYNAKEMRRDGLADPDSYSVPPTPAAPASPLGGSNWDPASAALAAAGAGAIGGTAAAGAMRSPQSPRNASPGAYPNREANSGSPAPSRHAQSPAPGMMSPNQRYAQQPNRSYSSPNAQMRMGSPAPSQRDFSGMQRSASPAQLAHPQPQRSFTTGGYGSETGHGEYGRQDRGGYDGHDQGWGSGNQGRANQGYWGNNGSYR